MLSSSDRMVQKTFDKQSSLQCLLQIFCSWVSPPRTRWKKLNPNVAAGTSSSGQHAHGWGKAETVHLAVVCRCHAYEVVSHH